MNLTAKQFEQLMQTVADGWNEGNAHNGADCFSENAIYVEPPEKQLYYRRAALFEFFGGDAGTDIPMKMTWHHLAYEHVCFGDTRFRCTDAIRASWW